MADPAPAAPPSPAPSPAPAPAPAARPGSLTGVRYDAPISDQAFDRLGPGPEGQGRYARVRNQNNDPEWVPRSDLAPDPAVAPKPAAPGDPAPAPAASVVDGKLRVGEFELSPDDIASLMQSKAQADLRAAAVPPDGNYQAKLPDGFKMPEGLGEFVFNEADPAFVDLKRWAAGKELDQQTFSEMLSFYASSEAQKEAAFRAAQAREVEKLGANGVSRVTAIDTWLRSQIGDELTGKMRVMIVSSAIVEGFERLAAKHTSQGSASFSQAHRAPPEPGGPGRVSDEEYSRMSQSERWAYARSHDQKQFYPGGNGGER
jgi:hypothetical protein